MKRVKDLSKNYFGAPIKLYRADLDQLLDVLSQSFQEITISDKDFEHDSLDDVKRHRGSKIRDLTLRGRGNSTNPFESLSLEFESRATPVHVHSFGLATDLPFLQIKNILESKRNKTPIFLKWLFWISFALMCIAVAVLTRVVPVTETNQPHKFIVPIPIVVAVFIYFNAALWILMLRVFDHGFFNSITLVLVHEEPPFWRRNKNKIIVGAISAVIAGFIGGFITWLFSFK